MNPLAAKTYLNATRSATFLAVAALALTASHGTALTTDKTIRIGVGMAGVKIGMTRGQVRNELGKPKDITTRTPAFPPGDLVKFHYPKLDVLFWKGAPRNPSGSKEPDLKLRLAAVGTTRGSQRTSDDVGVGSTEKQVKRKIDKVKCEDLQFNDKTYRNCHVGSYECETPSWALGDLPCRVSAFIIENGKVDRVAVGWLGGPPGRIE